MFASARCWLVAESLAASWAVHSSSIRHFSSVGPSCEPRLGWMPGQVRRAFQALRSAGLEAWGVPAFLYLNSIGHFDDWPNHRFGLFLARSFMTALLLKVWLGNLCGHISCTTRDPACKQVLATRLAGEPLAKAERKFLRDGRIAWSWCGMVRQLIESGLQNFPPARLA